MNNNAGAFSPLSTTVAREDGQQASVGHPTHRPDCPGSSPASRYAPKPRRMKARVPRRLDRGNHGQPACRVDPVSVTGGRSTSAKNTLVRRSGCRSSTRSRPAPSTSSTTRQTPPSSPRVTAWSYERNGGRPHTAALTVTTDPQRAARDTAHHRRDPRADQKVNVTITRPGFR